MEQKPNLEKNISEWLKTQGYPLEIFTAHTFQEAGFYSKLSDFYVDNETEEHREIDITAQIHSEL